MRWLVASLCAIVASVVVGLVVTVILGESGAEIAWLPVIVAYPTLPLAVYIAISRYRLYEIDRIVSRTVGWAVDHAASSWWCSRPASSRCRRSCRASPRARRSPSPRSTVLAFGLFQPVRRRVQRMVDRRFDRARYDAERTAADVRRAAARQGGARRGRGRAHGDGRGGAPPNRCRTLDPGGGLMQRQTDTAVSRAWWAGPLALVLLALSLGMVAFAFASLVLPGADALPDRPSLILFLIAASVMLTYPFVGTLLAVRRPRNPLGWLLLLLGLGFTLSFFSTEYLGRATISGWPLPGAVWVAWLSTWTFVLNRVDRLRLDPAPVPDRTRALAALGARGLGDRDRDGRRGRGRGPRPGRARRRRRGVHEPRRRPGPRGADRRDQRPVHAGHRDPRRAVRRVAAAPLPPVAGRRAAAAPLVPAGDRDVPRQPGRDLRDRCRGAVHRRARRGRRDPDRGGDRHPPLSPVRHRPADQPHDRVGGGDGGARRGVRRRRRRHAGGARTA